MFSDVPLSAIAMTSTEIKGLSKYRFGFQKILLKSSFLGAQERSHFFQSREAGSRFSRRVLGRGQSLLSLIKGFLEAGFVFKGLRDACLFCSLLFCQLLGVQDQIADWICLQGSGRRRGRTYLFDPPDTNPHMQTHPHPHPRPSHARTNPVLY